MTATIARTRQSIRHHRNDGMCGCGFDGETFAVSKVRDGQVVCTHFDICLDCAVQCQQRH